MFIVSFETEKTSQNGRECDDLNLVGVGLSAKGDLVAFKI